MSIINFSTNGKQLSLSILKIIGQEQAIAWLWDSLLFANLCIRIRCSY